jgi:hypothetical protein
MAPSRLMYVAGLHQGHGWLGGHFCTCQWHGGQHLHPSKPSQECSAEGSASRMNSAGRDSSVPNISSAEEMALSSLGAVLRPRRTQGRCSGHSVLVSHGRSAAFSWPWHLSTMPLLCGWYALDLISCTLSSLWR